jgi:hypothetical protein
VGICSSHEREEKYKGRDHLEDLGVDMEIMSK